MKRENRLRSNVDFQRIRRLGITCSNSLIVLHAFPNQLDHNRFGFVVSKRVGKAVVRNRVKRKMREATRLRMEALVRGLDFVFIARQPIVEATYAEIDAAIFDLLRIAQPGKPAEKNRLAASYKNEKYGSAAASHL